MVKATRTLSCLCIVLMVSGKSIAQSEQYITDSTNDIGSSINGTLDTDREIILLFTRLNIKTRREQVDFLLDAFEPHFNEFTGKVDSNAGVYENRWYAYLQGHSMELINELLDAYASTTTTNRYRRMVLWSLIRSRESGQKQWNILCERVESDIAKIVATVPATSLLTKALHEFECSSIPPVIRFKRFDAMRGYIENPPNGYTIAYQQEALQVRDALNAIMADLEKYPIECRPGSADTYVLHVLIDEIAESLIQSDIDQRMSEADGASIITYLLDRCMTKEGIIIDDACYQYLKSHSDHYITELFAEFDKSNYEQRKIRIIRVLWTYDINKSIEEGIRQRICLDGTKPKLNKLMLSLLYWVGGANAKDVYNDVIKNGPDVYRDYVSYLLNKLDDNSE